MCLKVLPELLGDSSFDSKEGEIIDRGFSACLARP